MIVVDTNFVAYLLLPGSQTAAAEALLEAHPTWAAPPLWRSEWRNVLCGYLRRGSLSLEQVIALQEQAETLVIGHEEPVDRRPCCGWLPVAAAAPTTVNLSPRLNSSMRP